jgi:hypothetical protein
MHNLFLSMLKLIVVQERYTDELNKKHGLDIDPRLVPFDMDASYAAGEVYHMRGMSKGIDSPRFSEFAKFQYSSELKNY